MSLLKYVDWTTSSPEEKIQTLKRPVTESNKNISAQVADILQNVKSRGDGAVFEYTERFDKIKLNQLLVTPEEIKNAVAETSQTLKDSLSEAMRTLRLFHRAQKTPNLKVETAPGVICEKRQVAVEKVGLYIPGGTAPLPSTLMMLAIPALEAGCSEILLATPPNAQGRIHPVILTAAAMLGLDRIYKCGGAQAIGAMAYGTESIPQVHKIFGPGNAWVTEAKMQVAYDASGAAIDLPAGPSEVLVIGDDSASPSFIAADLLSQAEHDVSSQVIFISTSQELISKVDGELKNQLETLPRRDIALQALASSRSIFVSSLETAMNISNLYAPEHLILQVKNPRACADLVKHAGSVFIGPWSPESVGDYASGTNHVLPTYGFARAFSGVGLDSFTKSISFQELTPAGLQHIGPHVENLAEAEGLIAHRRAVTLRLNSLKENQ